MCETKKATYKRLLLVPGFNFRRAHVLVICRFMHTNLTTHPVALESNSWSIAYEWIRCCLFIMQAS